MPTLPNTKNKLTFGEYQRRLKENPDDPEIQEVNKKFRETIKLASLGIQAQFNSPFIEALKSLSFMGSKFVKNVRDSHTNIFEEINKRIREDLEGSKITIGSLPPSPQHRLNMVMNKLDYIEDLLEAKPDAKTISLSGIDIVSKIRDRGKKYKIPKRVAKLFLNRLEVSNFEIIKQIGPTIISNNYKRKKISQKDYYSKNKSEYDSKIKNVLKYLKKVAREIRYTFKFTEHYVKAAPIKEDD